MQCLEQIKEFLDRLLVDMFGLFEEIIRQNVGQLNEEIKNLIEETVERLKDYLQGVYPECPDIFPYIDQKIEEYLESKKC